MIVIQQNITMAETMNTEEEERRRNEINEISVERMMEFIQSKSVYQCTYQGCKAYFDRPYRLAQHILAHNNIRPYVCSTPNCGKAYTSKSHLDRHLRTVHMPQEKDVVYSCSRCFKAFANRQNLKRHLNTVHNAELSCEHCNMTFKKKNQLTSHMYVHTGIKSFSCEMCPETFVRLYDKKRHLRYHKMYTCQECKTEFNHWSKYQKHLKTEHQKDKFICHECGRTFKQRCHIVRHIKIHGSKTKTFFCPYDNCERYYSRNCNLKQHILVKHMNILHECTICNAQLSTKAKLNYHIQLHYNVSPEGKQPRLSNGPRKERKDEGSFKTSIALKLAGLTKEPEEVQRHLTEAIDQLHETLPELAGIPEEYRSTFSAWSKSPEHLQYGITESDKSLEQPDFVVTESNKSLEDSTLQATNKESENSHSSSSEPKETSGELQYTLPDSSKVSGDLQPVRSPPSHNVTVKTEFIEVEVDVPYNI